MGLFLGVIGVLGYRGRVMMVLTLLSAYIASAYGSSEGSVNLSGSCRPKARGHPHLLVWAHHGLGD
jgi:hypothetical protein